MLKRILKSTFVVDHPAGSRALLFPETNDGNNTRGLAPILQKLNKEEYETPQKCAADIRAVLQRTLQEAETKRGKETTTRTAILSVCQALFEKKYKVVQETCKSVRESESYTRISYTRLSWIHSCIHSSHMHLSGRKINLTTRL